MTSFVWVSFIVSRIPPGRLDILVLVYVFLDCVVVASVRAMRVDPVAVNTFPGCPEGLWGPLLGTQRDTLATLSRHIFVFFGGARVAP